MNNSRTIQQVMEAVENKKAAAAKQRDNESVCQQIESDILRCFDNIKNDNKLLSAMLNSPSFGSIGQNATPSSVMDTPMYYCKDKFKKIQCGGLFTPNYFIWVDGIRFEIKPPYHVKRPRPSYHDDVEDRFKIYINLNEKTVNYSSDRDSWF